MHLMAVVVFKILFLAVHTTFDHTERLKSAHIKWGVNVQPTEIPYIVSLRIIFGGKRHTCGGSILNERKILTAAHCVTHGHGQRYPTRLIEVIGGDIHRQQLTGQARQFAVSSIHVHPEYRSAMEGRDVALIFLDDLIPLAEQQFAAIELANDEVPVGTMCTMSGWGSTTADKVRLPEILQKLDLEIMSNADCMNHYGGQTPIFADMLCAVGAGSSCRGDSGGPLVCDNRVAGVTSFGINCNEHRFPSVYANVFALRGWINATNMAISQKSPSIIAATVGIIIATILANRSIIFA